MMDKLQRALQRVLIEDTRDEQAPELGQILKLGPQVKLNRNP